MRPGSVARAHFRCATRAKPSTVRVPTRPSEIQRAAYERLWRRAEEIRSLCGLPPLPPHAPGPDSPDPLSLAPLVEILLKDLEGNFRRELATRVQLEGLGELMAFSSRNAEPGASYRTLVNYLARALDQPRLWLGVLDGSPPAFTVYVAGDPAVVDVKPERVHVQWLQPDWLRWVALGKGNSPLWVGPTGSRKGGPWHPLAIRGELAIGRLSGDVPHCPGSMPGGRVCGLSRAPLQELAGGHRQCGQCEFRHIIGLLGVEGKDAPEIRSLDPVVPSLGAILTNLGLQEALDLETRFREAVIEYLPLGVVAIDARGHVLTWNRAAEELIGLSREDAASQPLARLLPERSWHDLLVKSLEQGSEEVRREHDLVRPEGSSVPVEVSTAPLRDSEGRIRGAVATLMDVSSIKSMEERIRQLDRLAALGRFASSVAHELRNPLTGIATGVQYLSRGYPEGDERHESVAFILREVVRLNTIIQDLFTASRPRDLRLESISLQDVAQRALRGLKPTPEDSGVTIDLEGADTWPKVMADADQIQQVLLNLIQNAVQATPRGGHVTLRVREGRGGSEIEVEDTGSGIAEEHREKIFDPFYTTRPKGTGLGLFVAHGIVQRHRGSIEVESEVGNGTRFRILLPGNRPE
ncbi:MAG TPA: ATP-binding protein, partial [Candidatus Eisenbacteria bacterium]|nr:ATP-binding protein [Candidatus Eisenbacteria bacterium]